MLYLPITKSWIISRTARAIYLTCAVLACTLFGALIAILLAMGFSGVNSLSAFPLALSVPPGFPSVLPGALGSATLSIAMWYFWFNFDKSSWARKAFWFLPLYLLLPIGFRRCIASSWRISAQRRCRLCGWQIARQERPADAGTAVLSGQSVADFSDQIKHPTDSITLSRIDVASGK